ncbi:MAG TPA: hypothetical protein EYH25_02590 [Thermotoga sp.]|nr:hypothetical protein [Thermotoga sp.]
MIIIFKFRLEKLLNLRKREESLIKHKIFDIRNQMLLMEEELNTIRKMIKEKSEIFLNSLREGLSGDKIREHQIEMYLLEELEREILEKIETLREKEEELLNAYKKKRMDRKMMEKLKSRRYKIYLRNMDRLSKKHMDEIAERMFWWGSKE